MEKPKFPRMTHLEMKGLLVKLNGARIKQLYRTDTRPRDDNIITITSHPKYLDYDKLTAVIEEEDVHLIASCIRSAKLV